MAEGNYRRSGTWLPGRVTEERSDGKLNIQYDSGKIETGVEKQYVRYVFKETKFTDVFDECSGPKVEYRDEDNQWHSGRVVGESRSGLLQVKESNKNGETADVANYADIRLATDNGRYAPPSGFELDEQVSVNYKEKGEWFPATIVFVRSDGTYDVEFEDNVTEKKVRVESIHKLKPSKNAPRGQSKEGKQSKVFRYFGPAVEAKDHAGRWTLGRVTGETADGSFEVTFDRTQEVAVVTKTDIRLPTQVPVREESASEGRASPRREAEYNKGDSVEGNFQRRGKWFPAVVVLVRTDGTYDIEYEDGEFEARVTHIRSIKKTKTSPRSNGVKESARRSAPQPAPTTGFSNGQKVEIYYDGAWFRGKVTSSRHPGFYDVQYDDGRVENRVAEADLRRVGPSEASTENKVFKYHGPVVEAKIDGSWKRGRVSGETKDGKFEISFDGTDITEIVRNDHIRLAEDSSKNGSRAPAQTDSARPSREGPSRGSSSARRHTEGSSPKNTNGSPPKHPSEDFSTRSPSKASPGPDSRLDLNVSAMKIDARKEDGEDTFKSGDHVEVNYKGSNTFYAAKIALVRTGGTYDIEYDDGEVEMRVPEKLIYPSDLGTNREVVQGHVKKREVSRPALKSESVDNPDERVKPSPARRTAPNGDAPRSPARGAPRDDETYVSPKDQTYDKPITPASEGSRNRSYVSNLAFNVGDAVEANYKMKGVWYPGKVRNVRSDGTFDIRYDDNEEERGVSMEGLRVYNKGRTTNGSGSRSNSPARVRDRSLSPPSRAM